MRNPLKATSISLCTAGLVLGLSACSTDSAVWGSEGAEVREAANQFVSANKGANAPRVCSDSKADLGSPSKWAGLSTGEPEKFSGKQWETYEQLSPTWVINLSYSSATTGAESRKVPSFLFFKGGGKDLCVVAVEWGELRSTS